MASSSNFIVAQAPQNKAEEGACLGTGTPQQGRRGRVLEQTQPITWQNRASENGQVSVFA